MQVDLACIRVVHFAGRTPTFCSMCQRRRLSLVWLAIGASLSHVAAADYLLLGGAAPISPWYFAIKSNKGYCSLVGSPAFITCSIKQPQYQAQFAFVTLDPSGGLQPPSQPPSVPAQQQPPAGSSKVNKQQNGHTQGAHQPTSSAHQASILHQKQRRLSDTAAASSNSSSGSLPLLGAFTALTGAPLLLLSRQDGLCGSQYNEPRPMPPFSPFAPPPSPTAHMHLQDSQPTAASAAAAVSAGVPAGTAAAVMDRSGDAVEIAPTRAVIFGQPVACMLGGDAGGTGSFYLWKKDLQANQTIDFAADWLYLSEDNLYCSIQDMTGVKAGLSCTLPTTAGASTFQLQPAAYPYASLTSLFSNGACGIAAYTSQSSLDVVCSKTLSEERTYTFTLLLQNPAAPLTSGSVVAILTYFPGLISLPLQRCCPRPESPHLLACNVPPPEEAAMPVDCWFAITKVGARGGEAIFDGDLVMLQSKSYRRFCSVSFDGSLLCVSSLASNASRNLFQLGLHRRDEDSGVLSGMVASKTAEIGQTTLTDGGSSQSAVGVQEKQVHVGKPKIVRRGAQIKIAGGVWSDGTTRHGTEAGGSVAALQLNSEPHAAVRGGSHSLANVGGGSLDSRTGLQHWQTKDSGHKDMYAAAAADSSIESNTRNVQGGLIQYVGGWRHAMYNLRWLLYRVYGRVWQGVHVSC